MSRTAFLPLLGLACLTGCLAAAVAPKPDSKESKEPKSAEEPQWVWFNEGNPAVEAPAETRYFRRVFTVNQAAERPIDAAELEITADNGYTVWLNGAEVGKGADWKVVDRFDVKEHLLHGKNILAVEAHNDGGPAGLMVRLAYAPSGKPRLALCSDATWKASKTAGKDWQKLDFDDSSWEKVKELGVYGKAAPWAKGAAAGNPRFTVPEGFRVEMAAKNPDPKDVFSLVNMTFDDKGRLLVSQENGPVLLCTEPDKDGVLQKVAPYCSVVKNCQGMCWVGDALLLMGNGPQGAGLYRCRDTKGADQIDEATLLLSYPKVKAPGYGEQGGMSEHGPHAILHGPDGLSLHRQRQPLLGEGRSIGGQFSAKALAGRPDDPGPVPARLDGGRAVAAPQRRQRPRRQPAPGGCVWRLDPNGKNLASWRPASVTPSTSPSASTVSCSPSTATWNGTKTCRGIAPCASAIARRAPSSSGAPGRRRSRPTTSTRCPPSTKSAAARRSAWSSTSTTPFPRRTRAPT